MKKRKAAVVDADKEKDKEKEKEASSSSSSKKKSKNVTFAAAVASSSSPTPPIQLPPTTTTTTTTTIINPEFEKNISMTTTKNENIINASTKKPQQPQQQFRSLPQSLLDLEAMFHAVDSVLCSFQMSRRGPALFHKLQPAVEASCSKSFRLGHLLQIKTIYPDAFDFSFRAATDNVTSMPILGSPSKNNSSLTDLIVSPHIEPTQQQSQQQPHFDVMIDQRRATFHRLLLQYVERFHDEFRRKQTIQEMTSNSCFDLQSIPPIPEFNLSRLTSIPMRIRQAASSIESLQTSSLSSSTLLLSPSKSSLLSTYVPSRLTMIVDTTTTTNQHQQEQDAELMNADVSGLSASSVIDESITPINDLEVAKSTNEAERRINALLGHVVVETIQTSPTTTSTTTTLSTIDRLSAEAEHRARDLRAISLRASLRRPTLDRLAQCVEIVRAAFDKTRTCLPLARITDRIKLSLELSQIEAEQLFAELLIADSNWLTVQSFVGDNSKYLTMNHKDFPKVRTTVKQYVVTQKQLQQQQQQS